MPGNSTRRNKPKGMEMIAAYRQKAARWAAAEAFRRRRKLTAKNAGKARATMQKVVAAIKKAEKATRNATMRAPRASRARVGNNAGMSTRKSARIAVANAKKAEKAMKNAAAKAEATQRKIEKNIERFLRKQNAANAKKKAEEAKRAILRAQLEAEEAEESAERAAAEAEKKLNAAANARKAGTPEKALTAPERNALNSLAARLGQMRLK